MLDDCHRPFPSILLSFFLRTSTTTVDAGELLESVHQNDATGRIAIRRTPGHATDPGGQCQRSDGKVTPYSSTGRKQTMANPCATALRSGRLNSLIDHREPDGQVAGKLNHNQQSIINY
jgi:hypothetical protein